MYRCVTLACNVAKRTLGTAIGYWSAIVFYPYCDFKVEEAKKYTPTIPSTPRPPFSSAFGTGCFS